jgi:hypothetical protein
MMECLVIQGAYDFVKTNIALSTNQSNGSGIINASKGTYTVCFVIQIQAQEMLMLNLNGKSTNTINFFHYIMIVYNPCVIITPLFKEYALAAPNLELPLSLEIPYYIPNMIGMVLFTVGIPITKVQEHIF